MSESLTISEQDLASLSNLGPGGVVGKLIVKALMSLRNAEYDLFGSLPAKNIAPYWYQFSNTIAKANQIALAGGTAQNSIKISSDAGFVGMQIVGTSSGPYLVNARIDASDRILMNEPVNSAGWMGTAERPHYLPKSLLVPANSTISFDLTDLSGAINNEIYCAFVGYKWYRDDRGFVGRV